MLKATLNKKTIQFPLKLNITSAQSFIFLHEPHKKHKIIENNTIQKNH